MPTRERWSVPLILTVGLMTAWTQTAFAVDATGGTITKANGYRIHVFTNNGTLTVTRGGSVDVLVVAGGGGGGQAVGGGGGAGGLVWAANYPLRPGTKTITVGNGGAGASAATAATNMGTNGQNSVFDVSGGAGATITAIGGGGGGTFYSTGWSASPAAAGGSAGGAGFRDASTPLALQGNSGVLGATGCGNKGGSNIQNPSYEGGGGGGAGGQGTNATASQAGNGGVGIQFSQFAGLVPGSPAGYFAGGGGAGGNGGTAGSGGLGGGGNGAAGTGNINGTNGLANTGGGGGGGAGANSGAGPETGGSGGSGIVIVRELLNPSSESVAIGAAQDNQVSFGATGGTLANTVQGPAGTNTTLGVRGQNTGANSSKAWIKFDLSGLDYNANTSATVVVTAAATASWAASLRLYALTNGFVPGTGVLGTEWTEGSITWSNAPGNAGSAGNNGLICEPATTTLIGTNNPATTTIGDQFAFTIPKLGNFLQANTTLTVMLVFSPQNAGTTFASKEHPTLSGPKLTFMLKDPVPTAPRGTVVYIH